MTKTDSSTATISAGKMRNARLIRKLFGLLLASQDEAIR